jgi:hypothetical protein
MSSPYAATSASSGTSPAASNPPTQAQVQAITEIMDESIVRLQRGV